MAKQTLTREIDAPAVAVWAVLVDPTLLVELSPSTVDVDTSGPLQQVGDRFDQTVRLAGRRFTSTWEVTRLEPQRELAVAGSVLPGTKYSMHEVLMELGDTRSSLELTIDYSLPFGPLGRLADRLGAERTALREAEQVIDGVARMAEERARQMGGQR